MCAMMEKFRMWVVGIMRVKQKNSRFDKIRIDQANRAQNPSLRIHIISGPGSARLVAASRLEKEFRHANQTLRFWTDRAAGDNCHFGHPSRATSPGDSEGA